MKRSVYVFLGCVLTAGLSVQAQDSLDQRAITVEPQGEIFRYTPVSVKVDGDASADRVDVIRKETMTEYPATLRNGELVFVPEGGDASETFTYVVQIDDEGPAPAVRVEPKASMKAIDVFVFNKLFTTLHYEDEHKKPFLWPVYSDGQTPVTRAWPMGERELTRDHPHHKSMWGAYGDINGADLWGERGTQEVLNIESSTGGGYGWIAMDILWKNRDGDPVMTESREYRFYAMPSAGRYIDQKSVYKATHGEVKIGDTKEGGIVAFRTRDIMTENKGGTITMTDGRTGHSNVWGKPSAWCDYSGDLRDEGVHGIAIFDHPDNLRHPTRWHVRDYGLMGPNPFGLSYFTANEEERLNGDYTIAEGGDLTFNYRVYIHAGDVDDANVGARYTNYATPPKATWAE